MCRQRSLFCLCWRRLPPSLLLNMGCLNAACNSQSHSLASETMWETVVCPFPRKENIHIYSTRLFRSFGNCFLKPEVESGWVEGWGRSLMLTWGFVTLFRCISFCFPSLILFTVVFPPMFSRGCWPDWQGENHSSLLISQASRGKQGLLCWSFKSTLDQLEDLWPLCACSLLLDPCGSVLWAEGLTSSHCPVVLPVQPAGSADLQFFLGCSFVDRKTTNSLCHLGQTTSIVSLAPWSAFLFCRQDRITILVPFSFCALQITARHSI